MSEEKAKDGVTLIADAIRKEREERAKSAKERDDPNKVDVTAQFVQNAQKDEEKPETDKIKDFVQNAQKEKESEE